MAPTSKVFNTTNKIATRSQAAAIPIHPKENKAIPRAKRKADASPSKENIKRTALGDLCNNANNIIPKLRVTRKESIKKVVVTQKTIASVKTVQKVRHNENLAPPLAPAVANKKIATRSSNKQVVVFPNQTVLKPKDNLKDPAPVPTKKRLSNEFEKTEDATLYCTALEDIAKKSISTRSTRSSSKPSPLKHDTKEELKELSANLTLVAQQLEAKLNLGNHEVPDGVSDFDKDNWDDIYQVSHYAMDIFNYLKEREKYFHIGDYMDRQVCLSKRMRSLLVDWMVEIQESFELNHETLYLGVKLVDMYLDHVTVTKEMLQLVGAAAMFIACKYDERIPPQIDDFLYICDGAYTRRELIRMEIHLLKISGFDIGIPISYRFLRRYARCAKITMPILTLARFILELSLMDYETIKVRDSILASAALYLALRMKNISRWTPTLEFYTGYKLEDIRNAVYLLNGGLHKPVQSQLMTVRNKYSHKIFFEVAKTPLLDNECL